MIGVSEFWVGRVVSSVCCGANDPSRERPAAGDRVADATVWLSVSGGHSPTDRHSDRPLNIDRGRYRNASDNQGTLSDSARFAASLRVLSTKWFATHWLTTYWPLIDGSPTSLQNLGQEKQRMNKQRFGGSQRKEQQFCIAIARSEEVYKRCMWRPEIWHMPTLRVSYLCY